MKRLLSVLCLLVAVAGCAVPREGSPTVYFLSERENDDPDMAALFEGVLTLENGCLRLQDASGEGYAAVWPSGFSFRIEDDEVYILNREEKRITKVSERILVGGGEMPGVRPEELAPYVEQPVRCQGTYWSVASVEERVP